MAEIEKSFTFLRDSIPQWLRDIASVEDKVAAMQQDVVRVPTALSPFAKRRSGSMESIRPDGLQRMGAIAEEAAPSQGAQTEPAGNRKRKTLSVASGRASGLSRFRRTMVITRYDGDMQKSLELLVRAIGAGRNLLRKAKMEAKMNELVALAESSDDDDDDDAEGDGDGATTKVSYRPRMASLRARAAARRGGAQAVGGTGSAPVSLFDATDKTLENAQVLCEKAAHLTLRDGDCRTELEAIRKGFADVFETAETEAAKCAATRPLQPPEDRAQDTSDTSVSSVEPSYKRHFPQISPPSPQVSKDAPPPVPITTLPTAPKTMVIEVDDDDDDEEEDFAMSDVRLTSRYRTRA